MEILKGNTYRCLKIPDCAKDEFIIGHTYKCNIDNYLKGMSIDGYKNYTSYFELVSESQEINLQAGDTFKNSNGNLTTIVSIDAYDNIYLKSSTGTQWYTNDLKIKRSFIAGKYTDYKSASQQSEEWKPKVGDWVYIGKETGYWNSIVQLTKVGDDDHNYAISKDGKETPFAKIYMIRAALPHEIPTTMKQWKKEDFYNTKIIVDTPEKSRRFQELMFSLGIKWQDGGTTVFCLHIKSLGVNDGGNIIHSPRSYRKEIFYDEIFNENSNQQQLNQKQNGKQENSSNNDVFGKNLSGSRGKETATAIPYRKTSTIASSSGYIGNRIQGRTVKAAIGRSEISFSSIAA